ncbi:MAG: redoxin domain-containing protein [Minicystis sp.]
MTPLFEQHGVRVIALSKDGVAEARAHKAEDRLPFLLLSDPPLKVIRAFGLLHEKALEFKTWTILGLPLGVPRGKKSMAIPTTVLVDERGVVRWIDQATDYRLRGDEARLRAALTETFGAATVRRADVPEGP